VSTSDGKGTKSADGGGHRQGKETGHAREEELADWRADRNAVYQLAAHTVGAGAPCGCRRINRADLVSAYLPHKLLTLLECVGVSSSDGQ
jgi:hypothetical protein